MLDIKEIERRLKNDIEVKLECVDTLGFTKDNNDANRKILDSGLFVELVDQGSIFIKGCGYNIVKTEYKYFRIKEEEKITSYIKSHTHKGVTSGVETDQSKGSPYIEDNPTFNDLIDVAVQAHKDKLIGPLNLREEHVEFDYIHESYSYGCNKAKEGIDFINSLYTETFVVENEEDEKKIQPPVKSIILANGQEIIGEESLSLLKDGLHLKAGAHGNIKIPFALLKGATVAQKRGE